MRHSIFDVMLSYPCRGQHAPGEDCHTVPAGGCRCSEGATFGKQSPPQVRDCFGAAAPRNDDIISNRLTSQRPQRGTHSEASPRLNRDPSLDFRRNALREINPLRVTGRGAVTTTAWLLTALLLVSLLLAPLAQAENLGPGGGTRVIAGDESVGPYRILFTSSPEPAQIGRVTFVVRLSDIKTDEKVRGAEVVVDLKHSETGATLSQAATHADAGNPTDYAAHVQIDQTGQWQGVLRVRGAAGTAEVPFMQRVAPKRQLSTLVLTGIPFLVILGLMAGLWFVRSGSQPKR